MKLTTLVYMDGSTWVAQCLELDIAAQGPTELDCKDRFMRTVASMIRKDLEKRIAPLSDIGAAPEEFFYRALNFTGNDPELPVYAPSWVRARVQFLQVSVVR